MTAAPTAPGVSAAAVQTGSAGSGEQVGASHLSGSMYPNEYPRAMSSDADLHKRDRGAGADSEAGYIPNRSRAGRLLVTADLPVAGTVDVP